MDNKKKIEELIFEDLEADNYKTGEHWNGYNVYIPVYDGSPKIGLPYYVLEKGDEVRISTVDEAFAYLDFLNDGNTDND